MLNNEPESKPIIPEQTVKFIDVKKQKRLEEKENLIAEISELGSMVFEPEKRTLTELRNLRKELLKKKKEDEKKKESEGENKSRKSTKKK
jgi:hypothetical protein